MGLTEEQACASWGFALAIFYVFQPETSSSLFDKLLLFVDVVAKTLMTAVIFPAREKRKS
jgi:hypothetical protein